MDHASIINNNHMKPTQKLTQEHGHIILALKIFDKIRERLERGEQVDLVHLDKLTEFFRIYVEKNHYKKEESLLNSMKEAEIFSGDAVAGEISKEHKKGHDLIDKFSDEMNRYKAGSKEALASIEEKIRQYVGLLDEHIKIEDETIYRLAEEKLPSKKQEELLNEFDGVEKDNMSEEKRTEFHNALETFRNIYLREGVL